MTYPELVTEISNRTGIRKVDVSAILSAFRETVTDTVALRGGEVNFPQLGKFSRTTPKLRKWFDPHSREQRESLACRFLFTPSVKVKRAMNSTIK